MTFLRGGSFQQLIKRNTGSSILTALPRRVGITEALETVLGIFYVDTTLLLESFGRLIMMVVGKGTL